MADQNLARSTAPSIICDQEAREIARRHSPIYGGSVDRFGQTGEIGTDLLRIAETVKPASPSVVALLHYVAHHGERPAQPDWITVERKDGGA